MNIMNILGWSYWFQQPYIARGTTMWIWVIIFLAAIFGGLILKFVQQQLSEKYKKKMANSFSNVGLTSGLLGLLWLFLRQEQVPFLAWRFWLLFLVAYALYVVIKNLKFIITRLPEIRAEHADKALKEKYLPK
ncbi:MAG: hypothetical protein NTW66_02495 [Candidatus Magasanikbacteria bacterium]|nr:hypothetical protein [Candidatus Magasanikbacteria bacterium]